MRDDICSFAAVFAGWPRNPLPGSTARVRMKKMVQVEVRISTVTMTVTSRDLQGQRSRCEKSLTIGNPIVGVQGVCQARDRPAPPKVDPKPPPPFARTLREIPSKPPLCGTLCRTKGVPTVLPGFAEVCRGVQMPTAQPPGTPQSRSANPPPPPARALGQTQGKRHFAAPWPTGGASHAFARICRVVRSCGGTDRRIVRMNGRREGRVG